MHKVLISEPRIGSYSAFLALALVSGYLLARRKSAQAGIKAAHIDNLALLIAILSLFGARLFSWIFYFPPGVGFWAALWDPGGGMVFYGGLVFGILAAILYARLARLALGNLLDVFAPGLALGLALGRVGCFLAGCCWGDVCIGPAELPKISGANVAWQVRTVPLLSNPGFPLAVKFPEGAGAYEQHRNLGLIDQSAQFSRPVHPVQLYEAALAFALSLFLILRFNRRTWPGEVFWVLVAGYSLIRFCIEFFRADNPPIYFQLTLSQVLSLLLGFIAVAVFVNRRASRSKVSTPDSHQSINPLIRPCQPRSP